GVDAPDELRRIEDQLDLAGTADRGGGVERERREQRTEWLDDDFAWADDLVDRAYQRLAGERHDDAGPALGADRGREQMLEPQHRHLLAAYGCRDCTRIDDARLDDVHGRNRVDLAADLEQHRLRERGRQRQAQRERRAAPGGRADLYLAAQASDRLAHEVE